MIKIITSLILLPVFLLGAACSAIFNGFMFGWFCVDREMHPGTWKIRDMLFKSKGGTK